MHGLAAEYIFSLLHPTLALCYAAVMNVKEIIQHPASDAVLLAANRANYREYFRRYMLPGSAVEWHSEPGLSWFASGLPADFLNEVFELDLADDAAEAAIDRLLAYYHSIGVPSFWLIWPGVQPSDLGARLERRGLSFGSEQLMVLDLADLHAPPPSQLEISRVDDEPTLREWLHLVGISFGFDDVQVTEFLFAGHLQAGFGDAAPMHRFIAQQAGTAVATCSLSYDAGVAGIYDVTTLPPVRKQGAGSAVVATALQTAIARGYHYAILQSSAMAVHVYERLGFRTVGTLVVYSDSLEITPEP